jgi:hypothetical protein
MEKTKSNGLDIGFLALLTVVIIFAWALITVIFAGFLQLRPGHMPPGFLAVLPYSALLTAGVFALGAALVGYGEYRRRKQTR